LSVVVQLPECESVLLSCPAVGAVCQACASIFWYVYSPQDHSCNDLQVFTLQSPTQTRNLNHLPLVAIRPDAILQGIKQLQCERCPGWLLSSMSRNRRSLDSSSSPISEPNRCYRESDSRGDRQSLPAPVPPARRC